MNSILRYLSPRAGKRKYKSLKRNRLHDCVQCKGVDDVQSLNLYHNEAKSGIRRPSGISDKSWDLLVNTAISYMMQSQTKTSFLQEFVRVLLDNYGNPAYPEEILLSLGISAQKGILNQNWEHTAFRFFRHFCPEDYRNAMSHSGLKFATLETDGKSFYWISTLDIYVKKVTNILETVKASVGDVVTIATKGLTDIDTVTIINGENEFSYYEKGKSNAFGDTMYLLKQTIIANKR